jgi:hypothetical protein
MPGNNTLRHGESTNVSVVVSEDDKQPWLFELSYWLSRKRFKIEVVFPPGSTFKPERVYIVETHIPTSNLSETSFGVIVHGTRQLQLTTEAIIISSRFDAYLPRGVDSVSWKLLTECEGKNTSLSLT